MSIEVAGGGGEHTFGHESFFVYVAIDALAFSSLNISLVLEICGDGCYHLALILGSFEGSRGRLTVGGDQLGLKEAVNKALP